MLHKENIYLNNKMVCPICIITAAAPIIATTVSAAVAGAAVVKLNQRRIPPPILSKNCNECRYFKNGLCTEYDIEAKVAKIDPNMCDNGKMWLNK